MDSTHIIVFIDCEVTKIVRSKDLNIAIIYVEYKS